MCNFVRQLSVAALAAVVTGGVVVPAAHGQFRVLPTSPGLVNPNFQVAPGLSVSQAAFNIEVLGRAFAQGPPFVFGFNRFPPTVVTPFAPVFSSGFQPGFPTFQPVFSSGFQPGFGGFFDPRFQPGFQRGFQPGFSRFQAGFQPSGFQPGFQRGFQPGFQRGFGPGFRSRF